MFFLLLAAALPGLYWDQGPESAPQLKAAGIAIKRFHRHEVTALRADLARFTFLLAGQDGERLFGEEPQ